MRLYTTLQSTIKTKSTTTKKTLFILFRLGTVPKLRGRVAVVALMGNPVMIFERLISGLESVSALKKMEEGHCPEDEVKAMEGSSQLTYFLIGSLEDSVGAMYQKHRETFH